MKQNKIILFKDFLTIADEKTILEIKPIGYSATKKDFLEGDLKKYNVLESQIINIKPSDFNKIIITLKMEDRR